MVLEPNFTRVTSSVRKNIGITQSVVELKLPTNEDMIDTIYSAGAKSTIVSSEPSGNEVNFVGLVDFQVMYESQGVSALDYSAEFKDKFTYQEELSGELVLTSNVIDVCANCGHHDNSVNSESNDRQQNKLQQAPVRFEL